jgi:hypothetical protein
MQLKGHEDAYGQAMLDHLQGRDAWEIVERDDGHFSIGAGPKLYLAQFKDWRPVERRAMRYVRGRVFALAAISLPDDEAAKLGEFLRSSVERTPAPESPCIAGRTPNC